MDIVTRAEAQEKNLVRYFTGEPCKHGHVSERNTKSGNCLACNTARRRRRYHKEIDKFRAYQRRWKKENFIAAKGYPEPTRPRPEACECCGNSPGVKGLHLDHNHETGEFRGWLCGPCNMGIGCLGDALAGVEAAVRYLNAG